MIPTLTLVFIVLAIALFRYHPYRHESKRPAIRCHRKKTDGNTHLAEYRLRGGARCPPGCRLHQL